MSTQSDDHASGPTRGVQQTYLNCLEARQNYIELVASGANEAELEAAHARLHSKVFAWYETLRAYLEEYDSLEYFWEQIELWETGVKPQTVPRLQCPDCNQLYEVEGVLQEGDACINCQTGFLVQEAFYVTDGQGNVLPELDDDGEPVYEYVEGLKSLDGWQNRTTTKTVTGGTCRVKKRTRTVPIRLNPTLLLVAARALDMAADRLGVLADVKKDVPNTEITNDTIEKFHERIQEVVQSVQDGDERTSGLEEDDD